MLSKKAKICPNFLYNFPWPFFELVDVNNTKYRFRRKVSKEELFYKKFFFFWNRRRCLYNKQNVFEVLSKQIFNKIHNWRSLQHGLHFSCGFFKFFFFEEPSTWIFTRSFLNETSMWILKIIFLGETIYRGFYKRLFFVEKSLT